MTNDIPIYSCTGSAHSAEVHRKTGLYSSQIICTIYTGTIIVHNPDANALHLATMLCEVLEAQREQEQKP